MKRRHDMPFGASIEEGGVRFRLWAPACDEVSVILYDDGEERRIAMDRKREGWHEGFGADIGADARYHYQLPGGQRVPDPASRFQPDDVHGASEVVDPGAWEWQDDGWSGRDWAETVLYELHVGTFTAAGNFRGASERLQHLAELGVTAIELMPVADFPGGRNWGYDGVLPFAPDAAYGRPEDLKHLVDEAHGLGLMVFLDVVYNHFGPEGNYLPLYAPQFFTERHTTPWGAAIDMEGADSRAVRDYYIENALYWLTEYHMDGLRFDAVHAIFDYSEPHVLVELSRRVRQALPVERHVHLVLENDDNAAHYLNRREGAMPDYVAQWNDDLHHALHVSLTNETGGYYSDYADDPRRHLGRSLAEGFAYQGEPSQHRDGRSRGEPSAHLPPTAFVGFLQNHDQVGNRAFGERITELAEPAAVRAATAVLLLSPQPPLLFMGQEWGTTQRFPFFGDFEGDLAEAILEGRRREFTRFPEFAANPEARMRIPDLNAPETFESAVLDWSDAESDTSRDWLAFHGALLAIRHAEVVHPLKECNDGSAAFTLGTKGGVAVEWDLGRTKLILRTNLSPSPAECLPTVPATARPIFATPDGAAEAAARGELPPWSTVWFALAAA